MPVIRCQASTRHLARRMELIYLSIQREDVQADVLPALASPVAGAQSALADQESLLECNVFVDPPENY